MKNVFASIVLFILPFLFFHQLVFSTNVVVLGDFSGSDLLEMQLPHKYILRESVIKGEFPLWSVYNGTGFPVHAEGQGGYFYPFNLILALLFEPFQALNYSILISLGIAGVGTFVFARSLPRMSLKGAFLAAVVFMFSSFFIARMKHVNMIAVACWLPMSLYLIRMLCVTQRMGLGIALGAVWGMMFLAGHPQMAYYSVLIGLWWLIGEIGYQQIIAKRLSRHVIGRLVLSVVWASIIGLGFGAVQILPSLELIRYSYRAEQSSFFAATAFPFNPVFIFSLFYPYLLGNPAEATYPKDISFWGVWWENVWYVGVLPLVVLVGFCGFVFLNRKTVLPIERLKLYYYPLFVAVSGLLFAYISLGRSSVLYLFLYYIVPGVQLFRFPQRFGIVLLLAISLLFGWVVGYMLSKSKKALNVSVGFVVIVLLCIADLYWFAHSYIAFRDYKDYFLIAVDSLARTAETNPPARIYPTFAYVANPYLFLGWKEQNADTFKIMNSMLPGNLAAMYGLHSFSDRDWFEGGLDIADLSAVEWRLLRETLDVKGVDTTIGAKLLGLWNVQYIQTVVPFENPSYTVERSFSVDSKYYPTYYVYRNSSVMPRGFVVNSTKVFENKDGLLNYMFSEEFDPSREALFVGSDNVVSEGKTEISEVNFERYDSQLVTANVVLDERGVFVISDLIYPGWEVYVDGQRNEAVKINLVQRGVWLESGSHRVEWKFVSQSFHLGLMITAGTVVGSLSWLFIFLFLKRYNRTI